MMRVDGRQSSTVVQSGIGQLESKKHLFKNGSVEGLKKSRNKLLNQTSSHLKTFEASPRFFAGA